MSLISYSKKLQVEACARFGCRFFKVKYKIMFLLLLSIAIHKTSYCSDTINKKNTFYIESIVSYNGIVPNEKLKLNGVGIKPSTTTFFALNYVRKITKRFSLGLNVGYDNRIYGINNLMFVEQGRWTLGSGNGFGQVLYIPRSLRSIMVNQTFSVIGIKPRFKFIVRKKITLSSTLGFENLRVINQNWIFHDQSQQNFNFLQRPDMIGSSPSYLFNLNNFRFETSLNLEYSFNKSFSLNFSPFYNLFLNKTSGANPTFNDKQGNGKANLNVLTVYSHGVKLGIGYRW